MGYTINEAKVERNVEIQNAIKTYNCYALDRIAKQMMKEGDEEEAEKLQALSAKLDDEMTWAYDEVNNN